MEKKWYIYALDLRTGKLSTALSCPDKHVAFQVLHSAGNSLETNMHGGSLFFDYGVVGVGSYVRIEYKPYKKKGWFNKENTDVYGKSEFSIDDFTVAEIKTKNLFLEIRGYHRSEIGDDVMFIWYAHSALQKLVNEVSSMGVCKPTESKEAMPDYPLQIQAASGRFVPDIVLDGDFAEIGDTTDRPLHTRDVGVYSDVLRAFNDAKNPDPKYRRWAMWKSGVRYVDIAKLENPTWETEYGKEKAQTLWATEANTIRMQVQRFEETIVKRQEM